jgi:hypothetical protein
VEPIVTADADEHGIEPKSNLAERDPQKHLVGEVTMSWRTGLDILIDILYTVDKYEMDENHRLELKADLLRVFLDHDIDPCGLEDDPVIAPIFAKLVR